MTAAVFTPASPVPLPVAALLLAVLLASRQVDDLAARGNRQLLEFHAPHVRHVHAQVQPLGRHDAEPGLPRPRAVLPPLADE